MAEGVAVAESVMDMEGDCDSEGMDVTEPDTVAVTL